MLKHAELHEIQRAAEELKLARSSLLAGLSPVFVNRLEVAPTPADQLLRDLDALNAAGTLDDGTVPLLTWLENATVLAGPRVEAAVFQRAKEALAAPPGPQGPPPAVGQGAAPAPARSARAPGPAKILFLAANPSDTTRLALDREVREIEHRLRKTEMRDAFTLEQAWAVRREDLQECLLRHKPSIVHFSGHGSDTGELLLDDASGQAKPVEKKALANLFRLLRRNIRCVVLDACFSEPQAAAIAENIDCVVGMRGTLDGASTTAFAGGFYQALGYGESVEVAFELGKNEIDLAGLDKADVPHLVCRADVDAGAVFLHQESDRR
jgi:hypothetical protein